MRCFAQVIKIGEIFAEFGYSLDTDILTTNAIGGVSQTTPKADGSSTVVASPAADKVIKWQLRLMNESRDVISEDEIQCTVDASPKGASSSSSSLQRENNNPNALSSSTKVVKVRPSTIYLVQVRVMLASTVEWLPWSDVIRTRSFCPVRTSLQEIGEDYVRLQWDRPLRDSSQIAPEVNAEAVRKVAEISQFCLRVVREVDMYEVFNQEFATGSRTYTLHNLRSGSAHIVYARYRTLIGTMTNWTEVARFYTEHTFELALAKRGEDTFTVKWGRPTTDLTTMGYVMPDSAVHRFELTIVGEGLDIPPLELSSTVREHTFKDLVPGAMYRVRVRSLTKDGRWGVHSKVLKVVLASRPVLHPIATGETFLSFTWQRPVEEPQETDIEWHVRSGSSEYEAEKAVFIRKGPHNKKFTIDSLVANTIYFVRVRTLLMGEWGMWSEPQRFMTAKSMSIQLLERGESFFTVTWPIHATSKDLENDCRFELVLVRLEEETGNREVVMQEEVVKDTDEGYRLQNLLPNTTYELKGRAWQRNRVEGTCMWGQYSNTLRVRTLQNVALKIASIGEDFAELSWTRALSLKTGSPSEELWKDLRYEVIIGCVDTGEDAVVHKEVVDTTCTIDNLLPATTYAVSVRACDDREQWGAWSHARFHTLPGIQTNIHEIGETFVRVMWRRETDVSLQELVDHEEAHEITDQPPILQGDPVSKEFMLYIFSNDYDNDVYVSKDSGYPRGGNSEISLVQTIQSHHSSFRVCDLLPDRTYTAVLRAASPTGRWGIWSQEIRFHTTSPFRVPLNTLQVGENYIRFTWGRDSKPTSLPKDVLVEDYAVTSQQIRFIDTETNISKEFTVAADQREEKLRGLQPSTPYAVQVRACNKSGEWGQWSVPVVVLTRSTIICKSVEIAEDYLIVAWERPKIQNPHNYATGRGTVSSYELRVTNKDKTHLSTFVLESPFKISNLAPNTYYCVELKANYNDDEWGMWSTPLWCLTMHSVQAVPSSIGEEHCTVRVVRPAEERARVPEDDGNRANDTERVLAFGKHRGRCQLCVTTAKIAPPPHAPRSGTFVKSENTDSISLPADIRDEQIIYLVEVGFEGQDILHTIPKLKANTIYSVVARTRIDDTSDWGMWSLPTQRFITVAKTEMEFIDIGESYVKLRWDRGQQDLAGVQNSASVAKGVSTICKSKIQIQDSSQHFTFIEVNDDSNVRLIEDLKPSETYRISIQLMSPDGTWGVWSPEAKVRTVPPMRVTAENISEDAVWLSWVRESDLGAPLAPDTFINCDTSARSYELSIRGEGGFNYTRVIDDGNNCFFRGLQPDTVYEAWLRAANGLWSRRLFATLPSIRVTFGNIGEHFAVIEWRRNLPACINAPNAKGLDITQAEDKIEKFCLRVELPGEPSVLYELPRNVGTYRLTGLRPSSEYSVWMCARGHEGVWGLWNSETRVRTLPSIDLGIDDIGEDYVSVSWARGKWQCSHPQAPAPADGADPIKTWEIQGSTTGYEVNVLSAEGILVGRASTDHRTTRCTIGRLSLKSAYAVSVRAKDTYGEWGLWSTPKNFVTLQPVCVNVLRIGENYATIEWERRTRLRLLLEAAAEAKERAQHIAEARTRILTERLSNKRNRRNKHHRRHHRRQQQQQREGGSGGGDEYADDFEEGDNQGGEEESDEEDEESDFFEEDEEDEEYEDEADDEEALLERLYGGAGADEAAAAVVEGLAALDEGHPPDAVRGNEEVQKWAVRVYGSTVFGGLPGSEGEFREFFPNSVTTFSTVENLLPDHNYTIAIRAQNSKGQWGLWSAPITIRTQPLLTASVLDITETTLRIQWERPAYVPAVSGGTSHPTKTAEGSSSTNANTNGGDAEAVVAYDPSDPLYTIIDPLGFQFSFPDIHESHGYQVTIAPLEGETPFPPEDGDEDEDEEEEEDNEEGSGGGAKGGQQSSSVVNGARVYETSQSTLQFVGLAPGARYRITVREQMLRPDGTRVLLNGSFGIECAPVIVETILPMEVVPVDIGESQSGLMWRRRARANNTNGNNTGADAAIQPVRSTMRTAFYQLRVVRMAADGVGVYEGSMALRLTKAFRAPESSFLLKNLSPNAIYAVCVQAQLENGTWGPWSGEIRFATQKRLTLGIESINQDSLTVSWCRLGPDWLPASRLQQQGGVRSSGSIANGSSVSVASASASSPAQALELAIAERDRKQRELASIPPQLRSVITGDYSVKEFEIVIEGVTCQHYQCLTVDGSLRSTFIAGLEPNNVYCAYVRSLSMNEAFSSTSADPQTTLTMAGGGAAHQQPQPQPQPQWSLRSPKVLVATLNPLQLKVGRYTECAATVAWFREAQSMEPHTKAILKVQAAARVEAEQRERRVRFERQQLIQTRAETNEGATEEELAMTALRIEQAVVDASEAAHFLSPQNVHVGLAEVSGYQLHFYGEGGMPLITGTDHLLPAAPPKPKPKRRRTRSNATSGSEDPSSNGAADANAMEDEDAVGVLPAISPAETLLLAVKVNPKTAFVRVTGLEEGTRYSFTVRSRNAFGEWGPWSAVSTLRTLELLQLCQSRFGEHYINLYWTRPSAATATAIAERRAVVAQYSERFKHLTTESLEAQRRTLSAEAYADLMGSLRDWRAQQRWLSDYEKGLHEGEGEVESAADLPVVGYHLRVLNEAGAAVDRFFDASSAPLAHQHTLTGLAHNSMYAVLMCCDYGNGDVGSWSRPLKIMTQNTIQLSITYVGETFIDAAWKRAPNKKPNPIDADAVIIASPTAQGTGRQYEASLRYADPTTGAERDERRRIEDATSFRLSHLLPDVHYRIKIREWDPKGEWGMWGTEKRCVTLAAMSTTVVEVAEDWVDIKWGRNPSSKVIDYDDPSFIQRPVEDLRCFVRVEELPEDAATLGGDDEAASADEEALGSISAEDDVDLGLFLQNQRERHQREEGVASPTQQGGGATASAVPTAAGSPAANLGSGDGLRSSSSLHVSGGGAGSPRGVAIAPPAPPTEREPMPDDALYRLTKAFDASTTDYRIPNLVPGRFYKVQVLCETSGGQLGVWSPTVVVLTISKIKVRCDLVDESVGRVSWFRDPPRPHPTLRDRIADVTVSAACDPRCYEFSARGLDARTRSFSLDRTFDKDTLEHTLTSLLLNGCYSVRVRAVDSKGRPTLWSDDVCFVTLRRLKISASSITETSIRAGWGREEQSAADYPPTPTPLILPPGKVTQYHVQVFAASDLTTPTLDKMCQGATTALRIPNLSPNTAYVIRARSTNILGEWSLWSQDRTVYTMKPLTANVVTVGEAYVCLNWSRDEPDELPDVVRGVAEDSGDGQQGEGDGAAAADDAATAATAVALGGGAELDASSTGAAALSGADAADAALRALQMRRKFPLLDRPQPSNATNAATTANAASAAPPTPAVYVSACTTITKYCVSFSALGDTAADPRVVEVEGSATYFKIPNLRHDTVYEVAVRACYGGAEDEWGMWSAKIKAGTLNLLQIAVKQLGENYFLSEWRRSLNTYADGGVLSGRPEETLGYQFTVHDVSDVPIGDEAAVDLDPLLEQDHVLAAKSNVFNNLRSNRRYRLAVRRWYRPANLAAASAGGGVGGGGGALTATSVNANSIVDGTVAAADASALAFPAQAAQTPTTTTAVGGTNPSAAAPVIPAVAVMSASVAAASTSATSAELRRRLEAVGAVAGSWSEPITVATHKGMAVLISDISEGGMVVRWERDPNETSMATRHCVKVPYVVNSYHMHIDEVGKDGSPLHVPDTPGAQQVLRFNQEFQATEASFKVRDLKPDTVYRIEVRCSTDKVWGHWSRSVYAITLPRLQVSVASIGEDYASLLWERRIRRLTTADGTVAVTGNVSSVEKYELVMEGLGHHYDLKKKFKASRTSYRAKGLEPSKVYAVRMRSCEVTAGTANEDWSEWSDRVVFATLKPLQLFFGKVAEQFVHVSWGRDPQTVAEYAVHDKNTILGSTEVLSYHFCVFAVDQMPSVALIDKQFAGDVTRYRVDSLAPNTSYIMIARACNCEQQWGLWGEERIITTQKVLTTGIVSIGENYVALRWSRLNTDDEMRRLLTDAQGSGAVALWKEPTGFHLCLTSDAETIDKRFTSEECTYTADEARTPMYTVRGLRSDTKYIVSLQACYGGDEWGTWAAPIAFLTLNTISVKVANITETSAEFTWGRAQQNPTLAADPSVLAWRGTIVRYQLLLRKVDDMRGMEMQMRERALLEDGAQQRLQQQAASAGKKGGDGSVVELPPGTEVPTTTDEDGNTLPMSAFSSAPAAHPAAPGGGAVGGTKDGAKMSSRPASSSTAAATGLVIGDIPHFFFEQEIDVRLVKYVQTLSRIDKLEVNTEYHFQVRALDEHNEWSYWSEVFFDTPPSPPQNVFMRRDGAMVLLSWDPPSRVHSYMYCIEQCVAKEDGTVASSGLAAGAPKAKGGKGGKESPRGGGAGAGKKDGTAMEWRVVDTVEDTMARVRAFGPINRVQCRIKCCKINTPTHLFSRYSSVVTINSHSSVEPVTDLRVTSLSKSSAIIEWSRVENPLGLPSPSASATAAGSLPLSAAGAAAAGGDSGRAGSGQPPSPSAMSASGASASAAAASPRVFYRVMLSINNQPYINVATLKGLLFELSDLAPNTLYAVQVITETEAGSCQRNATLRFATRREDDRGVYKWSPSNPTPLGELTPPPQDRTLLMLGKSDEAIAALLSGGGGGRSASANGNAAAPPNSGRLPAVSSDRYGTATTAAASGIAPRPPQSRRLLGASPPPGPPPPSSASAYGAATPKGGGGGGRERGAPGSALLAATPASSARRPPGTAPHGATRRSVSGGGKQTTALGSVKGDRSGGASSARKPAPPPSVLINANNNTNAATSSASAVLLGSSSASGAGRGPLLGGGAIRSSGSYNLPLPFGGGQQQQGFLGGGGGYGVVLPPVGQRPMSGAVRGGGGGGPPQQQRGGGYGPGAAEGGGAVEHIDYVGFVPSDDEK